MRRAALTMALILAAGPALAHKLKVFALQNGQHVEGEVFFSGGGQAGGAALILQDDSGGPILTGTAGPDGRFVLAIPEGSKASYVIADSADGHRAEFQLNPPVSETPQQTAAPQPDLAEIESMLARQIAPLRADMQRFEDSNRFRDIAAGIGYILGLAGLVALVRARRK